MSKKKQKWSQKELDNAFEKFLQESVSDESFDGDRFHGSASQVKEEIPWWMQEEADAHIGGNKWLKPKKQSTPLKEEEEFVKDEESKGLSISKPGGDAEVVMSRDSLEDGPKSADNDVSAKRSDTLLKSQSFEENLNYTGVDGASTGPDRGYLSSTGPDRGYLSSTGPGIDTLTEQADKEHFFHELEAMNRGKTIDYGKLNADSDATGTLHPAAYVGTLRNSDESDKQTKDIQECEMKGILKPKSSMLSKVALLDTAESTLNVGKHDKERSMKAEGSNSKSRRSNSHRDSDDESNDLLNAGTATEIAALEAALQKAREDNNNYSSDGLKGQGSQTEEEDNDQHIESPGHSIQQARTVDDILREVHEDRKRQQSFDLSYDDPKGLMSDERGFDLSPVREKPKIDEHYPDRHINLQGDRGFDLDYPDRHINLQGDRGFDLGPVEEEIRGHSLLTDDPSGDRGFSLQPATQTEDVTGVSLRHPVTQVLSRGYALTGSADDESSCDKLSPSKPKKKKVPTATLR